jgi:hypothetical protein
MRSRLVVANKLYMMSKTGGWLEFNLTFTSFASNSCCYCIIVLVQSNLRRTYVRYTISQNSHFTCTGTRLTSLGLQRITHPPALHVDFVQLVHWVANMACPGIGFSICRPSSTNKSREWNFAAITIQHCKLNYLGFFLVDWGRGGMWVHIPLNNLDRAQEYYLTLSWWVSTSMSYHIWHDMYVMRCFVTRGGNSPF